MIVLGLMSGTSMDGLDLALVKLKNSGTDFELLKAETVAYSLEWETSLQKARELTGRELTQLHISYGKFLGEQVNTFLTQAPKPAIISSHGHTVFHQPNLGYTLQIGDLNEITQRTGIATVGDFRSLDVSKGGQGAPLAPIGDELLFSNYDYCINLGGISNYSYSQEGVRRAKDLSPCNIISNLIAKKLGYAFDEDGKLGGKGKVDRGLLEKLNNWRYYKSGKSMGVEDLEHDYIPLFDSSSIPLEDQLMTYYEHLGQIIGGELIKPDSTCLITGGGAKNKLLVQCIKKYAVSNITIPSSDLIDFKEAIIFSLMGYLRITKQTNILSSVTGAASNSSSGVIVRPEF